MNFWAILPLVIQGAIIQGTPLLYGATGEILTEKSGNLNLGIPGVMYIGAVSGIMGGYVYQQAAGKAVVDVLAVGIPFICCLIGAALASLLYCFLTVTLRANQNVTGLALTTFGIGVGEFFGGSFRSLFGYGDGALSLRIRDFTKVFQRPLPFADKFGWFGTAFLSHGFMVYLAIIVALAATFVLMKTRVGLHLRAVGESPATADAAGINVSLYKYISTTVGGMIAGLGGLYFVCDMAAGRWESGSFGDRGWLAIALVIFSTWKPWVAVFGSYLFGGLYIIGEYLTVSTRYEPLIAMLPYVVTILVLILVSILNKRENQPPASLGLSYFREER